MAWAAAAWYVVIFCVGKSVVTVDVKNCHVFDIILTNIVVLVAFVFLTENVTSLDVSDGAYLVVRLVHFTHSCFRSGNMKDF